MTRSRYSRPASSQTRAPAARARRSGSPSSTAAPNSASGRLLPVDVNPGTRQSVTVFHHLDRHRAQQLRLALVERHAVHDLAHRSHHVLTVAHLEEFDRRERLLGVAEETLDLLDCRRLGRTPRRLERPLTIPAPQRQLVQHHHDRVPEIQGRICRRRRDRDDAVTAIEIFVGKSLVLPPEQQRRRAGAGEPEQLRRCFSRTLVVAFRRARPGGAAGDVTAIGERGLERVEQRDARHDIVRLVRDPFDPMPLVFARLHEAQVPEPEVLHRAHDLGDVDELLGLVEHHDHGSTDRHHPTSSSTPCRLGSCRSPRSHTQPPPPLHTSCPARRSRPAAISLTLISKPTRPPTCVRSPSGHCRAIVMSYPSPVLRHAPRTSPASPPASETTRARTAESPGTGTTRYPQWGMSTPGTVESDR